ncbi:MAG TPA: hypothetical protein VGR57_10815 [Ktedonobacterales bacterium]|nr:hypothetical protein [Ktedonobacterales bacterium]
MPDHNERQSAAQHADVSGADAARREAIRENARRVLRASGVPEMLRRLNHEALKGRGTFDEYDSGVIFRWGSGTTRRHIWVDVNGDSVRFRLREHLRCRAPVPSCDGEYHTFRPENWGDRALIAQEIRRGYERPVAETSED